MDKDSSAPDAETPHLVLENTSIESITAEEPAIITAGSNSSVGEIVIPETADGKIDITYEGDEDVDILVNNTSGAAITTGGTGDANVSTDLDAPPEVTVNGAEAEVKVNLDINVEFSVENNGVKLRIVVPEGSAAAEKRYTYYIYNADKHATSSGHMANTAISVTLSAPGEYTGIRIYDTSQGSDYDSITPVIDETLGKPIKVLKDAFEFPNSDFTITAEPSRVLGGKLKYMFTLDGFDISNYTYYLEDTKTGNAMIASILSAEFYENLLGIDQARAIRGREDSDYIYLEWSETVSASVNNVSNATYIEALKRDLMAYCYADGLEANKIITNDNIATGGLTRLVSAELVMKYKGKNLTDPGTAPCPDVSDYMNEKAAVKYVIDNGIIAPLSNGNFGGSTVITRSQAAMLLCAMLKADTASAPAAAYSDITGHYAERSISTLYSLGILPEASEFKPDDPAAYEDFLIWLMACDNVEIEDPAAYEGLSFEFSIGLYNRLWLNIKVPGGSDLKNRRFVFYLYTEDGRSISVQCNPGISSYVFPDTGEYYTYKLYDVTEGSASDKRKLAISGTLEKPIKMTSGTYDFPHSEFSITAEDSETAGRLYLALSGLDVNNYLYELYDSVNYRMFYIDTPTPRHRDEVLTVDTIYATRCSEDADAFYVETSKPAPVSVVYVKNDPNLGITLRIEESCLYLTVTDSSEDASSKMYNLRFGGYADEYEECDFPANTEIPILPEPGTYSRVRLYDAYAEEDSDPLASILFEKTLWVTEDGYEFPHEQFRIIPEGPADFAPNQIIYEFPDVDAANYSYILCFIKEINGKELRNETTISTVIRSGPVEIQNAYEVKACSVKEDPYYYIVQFSLPIIPTIITE